jgi:hypothetical protein
MKGVLLAVIGLVVMFAAIALSLGIWGLSIETVFYPAVVTAVPLDIAASWYFIKNAGGVVSRWRNPWWLIASLFGNLLCFLLLGLYGHFSRSSHSLVGTLLLIVALVSGGIFWILERDLKGEIDVATEAAESVKAAGGPLSSEGIWVWAFYVFAAALVFLWAWFWFFVLPDQLGALPKLSAMVPPPEKREKKGWGEAVRESGAA